MDASRAGSLSSKAGVRRKSSASNLLATFGARPSSSKPSATPTSSASSSFPFAPEDSNSVFGYDYAESSSSVYNAKGSPAPAAPTSGVTGPDSLAALVQKRVTTWAYLKRAHEGKLHWFNTVLLTLGSLESSLDPTKAATRARQFYMLGMSFSPLFDMTAANDFLKGLLKLLDEWENWTENAGSKTMKSLFKGQKARKHANGSGYVEYAGGYQESGDALYLMLINMPFQPDYFQVLPTMCDIMIELYTKLSTMLLPTTSSAGGVMSPSATAGAGADDSPLQGRVAGNGTGPSEGQRWTAGTADMINKADAKLKKIISQLTRELDALARRLIDDELAHLLSGASGLPAYGHGLESFAEGAGEGMRDREFGTA